MANYKSGTVSIFRNTGTIGSVSFATKVDFTTGLFPISVAIGDVDGDGKPDIVVTNYSSGSISVFRNTGTIGSVSYAAKVDFMTGSGPHSVAIGDIDGDGKFDLAVANVWLDRFDLSEHKHNWECLVCSRRILRQDHIPIASSLVM